MNMTDTRIVITGLWIATMLTYLLGDVLRIFAGDATFGEVMGKPVGGGIWLLIAVIMWIPILMIVLTLTVPHPAIRWVNIGVAAFFILFNIAGLPYKGAYDNLLIGLSLVLKAVIVWQAWRWV
jgi:hypothetical protein